MFLLLFAATHHFDGSSVLTHTHPRKWEKHGEFVVLIRFRELIFVVIFNFLDQLH